MSLNKVLLRFTSVWINCVLVNIVMCSDVVGSLLNNQDSHHLDVMFVELGKR